MNLITGIPFLRILVPLVAGILAGFIWRMPIAGTLGMALLLGLALLILLWRSHFVNHHLFVLLADALLVLTGLQLVQVRTMKFQEDYYGNKIAVDSQQVYIGEITNIPVEKSKSYKLELRLRQVQSGKNFLPVKGDILLYVRKAKNSQQLKAGNILLFPAKLRQIQAPANPMEFDYRAYMAGRQVYHTAFIDSSAFLVVPIRSEVSPIWLFSLKCKAWLLSRINNSGLSVTSAAICAALLTGYDDDIERPVLASFSHTGTLHVLSVSGMHTGLIYLALNYLLGLADRHNRYRVLRLIFISLSLWFFALVAGLSAPVLRAVIMLNLLGIGRIFFRSGPRNQLNILCASALMLLFYDPFLVSDIGFLLSYFALAGLICFQPPLARLFTPSSRAGDFIWQSVTGSVAATISTLPITLYFFKQFPIWFILCNVVIIPASSLVLFLTIPLVLGLDFLSWLINPLIDFLLWFNSLFSVSGLGYADQIDFGVSDLLFCTLLILLLWALFTWRGWKLAYASALLLIAWQLAAIIQSYDAKSKREFTVYHINKSSAFALKNGGIYRLNNASPSDFDFHLKAHLVSYNNADTMLAPFHRVRYGKQRILITDGRRQLDPADLEQSVLLVLQQGYIPEESLLQSMPFLKTIVCDGSFPTRAIVKAELLARKFGIEFYNTRASGAYLVSL